MILVISASSWANQGSWNIGWNALQENIPCGLDLEAWRQGASKATIITHILFFLSEHFCFLLSSYEIMRENGCFLPLCSSSMNANLITEGASEVSFLRKFLTVFFGTQKQWTEIMNTLTSTRSETGPNRQKWARVWVQIPWDRLAISGDNTHYPCL